MSIMGKEVLYLIKVLWHPMSTKPTIIYIPQLEFEGLFFYNHISYS
jgi:hypothetical protein